VKVLVVDDDVDFRELARVFVNRSYPRAEVMGYDPQSRGLPASDFPWADYDVVLLDHELSSEQTGLDWLRRYSDLPGFPAVIFATGAGDENLAARAMKFGADEYLSKREISAQRLGQLISSVLAERASSVTASGATVPAGIGSVLTIHETYVPGYQIRRLLGCGGTADVYLAERESDGHTVVLKILREGMANNAMIIERLRREARILKSMDSAHVVRVYDFGTHNGRAYTVMEYLGHGDLSTRINEGLSRATACEYAQSIATGLVAVHGHGVVHRDLKPSNIMFRYDDSLALTDFGLALNDNVDDAMTALGSVVGTPLYMSPEQCDGARADGRSDLYALGIVLFEMLTGRRPFAADSVAMVMLLHATAPIPELPWELSMFQPMVDRLLDKDPAQRYSTANEVVRGLSLLSDVLSSE
jgi:serine/threonine protein kinase/CheY-like chemotaxis protein